MTRKKAPILGHDIMNTLGFENSNLIEKLQDLHLTAFNQAMKYRWDPLIGKIHLQYLESLEIILQDTYKDT